MGRDKVFFDWKLVMTWRDNGVRKKIIGGVLLAVLLAGCDKTSSPDFEQSRKAIDGNVADDDDGVNSASDASRANADGGVDWKPVDASVGDACTALSTEAQPVEVQIPVEVKI